MTEKIVLVVGDSINSGVDERRISGKLNMKIRILPVHQLMTCLFISYIQSLLLKVSDTIIADIGTNNGVNETSHMRY